jgi:hypothetical protein
MSDEMSGKAKGGFARAEILSPAQRQEIARTAAAARWGGDNRLPRATHSGTLTVGELKVPVFVLEDGTRLISQRGVQTTIGMSTSGGSAGAHRTAQMVERLENKLEIPNDLSVRMKSPLRFLTVTGGLPVYGNEATTLVDLCELILKARDSGVLTPVQERYAESAAIIVRSFAKVGIIALIDEATGYQEVRPRDALQAYLEKIIAKELATWAKKFPDEFYENIYRLKGWPWPGMRKNRYSVVAYYTTDLVYERIAPGLIQELKAKSPKGATGHRTNKLHQWLTEDIGNPMLAQHLYSIINFQRLAIANGHGWKRFVKMVDQVMPKRGTTLELPFPLSDEEEN